MNNGELLLPDCSEQGHCFLFFFPCLWLQNETQTTQKNIFSLLVGFYTCMLQNKLCHIKEFPSCSPQTVSASPRNLLKMLILRAQPRPTVQNSPGGMWVPSCVCFNQPSRQLWYSVQFQNHSSQSPGAAAWGPPQKVFPGMTAYPGFTWPLLPLCVQSKFFLNFTLFLC